jgi:hypothetical protein
MATHGVVPTPDHVFPPTEFACANAPTTCRLFAVVTRNFMAMPFRCPDLPCPTKPR